LTTVISSIERASAGIIGCNPSPEAPEHPTTNEGSQVVKFLDPTPRMLVSDTTLGQGTIDASTGLCDDFEWLGSARAERAVAAILGGHPLESNS
jgi:hypothetical protein